MPHPMRWGMLCACLATVLVAAVTTVSGKDAATVERGKEIFTTVAQPSCGVCHTLADAGSTGTIGVNLDQLKPTEERVQAAVRDGVGVMPAYKKSLSEEQIEAVSKYVARAVAK